MCVSSRRTAGRFGFFAAHPHACGLKLANDGVDTPGARLFRVRELHQLFIAAPPFPWRAAAPPSSWLSAYSASLTAPSVILEFPFAPRSGSATAALVYCNIHPVRMLVRRRSRSAMRRELGWNLD